ncbi:MAG: two-component system, cell cycle sensor histidine kinase and response regulator CckA [Chloroflexota bacterium]|jgi:signal transduction histidine kinase/ActR/RegA family two-component response regulator|nr:two-component system, cell cycle sensor histidine kinase and response regulator CckA [Chloroflexota bacterium]
MGALRSWLSNVRGRDVLERRQAWVLQLALIVLAIAFVVGAASNALQATMTATGTAASAGLSNLIAAVVMIGLIVALRRGFFRAVAATTVGFLIVAFGASLATADPIMAGPYLALLMVPIVLAGLTLPRPALLVTFVAVVVVGQIAARAQAPSAAVPLSAVMGNFVYASIFATAVVFGFGGTLRVALDRATAHERELETARGELESTVTQLQAATEEQQRLEAQLAQSQRLESIGRLAGGVAHDFNNLLTAIMGYASLLETESGGPDGPKPEVVGIRKAADQAAALTKQLLAFSRKHEMRMDVVDLSSVISDIEPLLRRLLGERVVLVNRPSPDLWTVLADRSQLEAAIVNLAVNARDAMANGGTLTIETANVVLDETYGRTHAEVEPGRYAMVAVSDTGTGIDTATLSHIFEPFFTTKELGKGTGLGLATVYGTIRQSAGHIWVYSEPNRGTTFKIYLPRTEQVADTVVPSSVSVAAAPTRDNTVLLAEDEELVRTFVVAALERAGYRVVAAASGEAALAYLAGPNARVGVIVTDVVMPGMSGPELLDEVWRTRPALPAILMSGYTAAALEQRSLPDRVALLEKPFTSEQLTTAIEAALARVAS